jgi:hypothetical protein
MIRRAFALACLLASPAAAHAAVAINLVPNPHFDDHVLGWTHASALSSKMAFAPLDQHGKPGGGSLRVYDIDSGAAFQVESACFAVDPGQPVVFGGGAYAPGAPTPQSVRASLVFYDNGLCAGNSSAWPNSLVVTTGATTWGTLQGSYVVPPGKQGARLRFFLNATPATAPQVFFDNAYVYQGISCKATDHVACLNGGRFRLSVDWEIPDGASGSARVHSFAGGGDSAYATFFDEANVELVVKVLDGCAVNEEFWVFAAGLTDVGVVVRVWDTELGGHWEYTNAQGEEFQPVLDTAAFQTCKR